jgi:plasmid maintenance system killer protein
MTIYFKTKKLQKQCSEMREMVKAFGPAMADKLSQRLAELQAADSLSDISHLPPPRCHELVNRNGVFSVDLVHPYRLLFSPANEPVPVREDGGIMLEAVFEVEVVAIEDTHDKKNQRRS